MDRLSAAGDPGLRSALAFVRGQECCVTADELAAPAPCGPLSSIEHVVFLMNENRSFDSYFGTYKGVRGFGDSTNRKAFAQAFPGAAGAPYGGKLLPFRFDTGDRARRRRRELPDGDGLSAAGAAAVDAGAGGRSAAAAERLDVLRAGGGTRTHDTRFTKAVLCQLSYSGACSEGSAR